MQKIKNRKFNRSFTFIEILIIIFLISIIYTISFNISVFKDKKTNIQSIKKLLLENSKSFENISFVLFDDCKKKAIFKKNKLLKYVDINISKNIEAFKIDELGNIVKIKFKNIIVKDKEYNVCFKYCLYKYGYFDSFILKENENYYVLFPYFYDIKKVGSLEKAKEIFLGINYMPLAGKYYE